MNILRAAIGLVGLMLLGLTIWAAFAMKDLHGEMLDQLAVTGTLPWGLAMLAALMSGAVLFFSLLFLTERAWVVALLWAAPVIAAAVLCAGYVLVTDTTQIFPPFWLAPVLVVANVWAAFWFVIRLPLLAKQLSKPEWPAS